MLWQLSGRRANPGFRSGAKRLLAKSLMDLSSNQRRDLGGIVRITLTVLLMARYTVADTATPGGNHDCQKGCRRTFKPVCGEDGRTYSNECVATCQDVQVVRAGPCPGEPLLHPDNKHVITDAEGGPAPSSSSSSAAGFITRQHLHAFRQEGFRYAGQMGFTEDMPRKHRAPKEQQQQQPGSAAATAGASGGLGLGLGLGGSDMQQNNFHAVRITREGHVYLADMDENVDRVLDLLIQHHQADAAASATAATGTEQQQQQQQQQASSVHGLLHSLQHWRGYRSSSRRIRTSKWARHTIISATSGPADHVLQPGLDVAAAAAGFAAQGPSSSPSSFSADSPAAAASAGAGSRDGDGCVKGSDNAPQQLQEDEGEEREEEEEGFFPWIRVLGGPRSDRSSKQQQQRQQQQQSGGREDRDGSGRGRGVPEHRQVRRSLGTFDLDDRVDCPRTPTYPFTAVGQINIRDSRGNYVCSGALVGPDVVLTAGHCVFSRAALAFYERLEFSPSRYRTLDGQVVNPFGVIPWSYVTLYEGYSSPAVPDANVVDLAVITLSQRIGLRAGWMGIFEPCSPYAPNRYVALTAGYPSDKPSGSCKTTQCVVVQEPCTDGYLYHKCDTAAGQSGSPMYMMAMTVGRKMGPYIRAVHNLEWVQGDEYGNSISYINSAVSITPDHYRSVLAWIGLSFTTNDTAPMGPALPPTDYMARITGS